MFLYLFLLSRIVISWISSGVDYGYSRRDFVNEFWNRPALQNLACKLIAGCLCVIIAARKVVSTDLAPVGVEFTNTFLYRSLLF